MKPPDPELAARLRRAHAAVGRKQELLQLAKAELLEVVEECSAEGMSLGQMALVMGVGKSRVAQLVDQVRGR